MIQKWTWLCLLISLQNLLNLDAEDFMVDQSDLENRIWQAGGSAEMVARGKCWIDGECANGPSWWIGSHDDSEISYRFLNRFRVI
jgi:hypothetical protein